MRKNFFRLCTGTLLFFTLTGFMQKPGFFRITGFADEPGSEISVSSGKTEDDKGGDESGEILEYDTMIRQVLELTRKAWQEEAAEDPEMKGKPCVEIKNTRILRIADDPVMVRLEDKPIQELQNVAYIVEFMMYSNYLSNTYPCNAGILDSAVVYRNGFMEVRKINLIQLVRSKYYLSDFSGVIEEIIDLGGEYNGTLF